MGCKGLLASFLKVLNYFQSLIGIGAILYSLWLLNKWNSQLNTNNNVALQNSKYYFLGVTVFHTLPAPWFIYACLGIGITVTVISCFGHIAAESKNGFCLCLYTILMCMFIILEGSLVADIFFNNHWEQDIPDDPTGDFDAIKKLIQNSIDIFKWIGLAILIIQVLSLVIAKVLHNMVSPPDYDSDEEYYMPIASNNRYPRMHEGTSYPILRDQRFVHKDVGVKRY